MALTTRSIVRTLAFIALTVGLGGLIGVASGSGATNEWYQGLARSELNPPGYVFGIVWPILYTLMAIAGAWLYERKSDPAAKRAWELFIVQLVINYAWSFIFFMGHDVALSLAWILGLIVLVAFWVIALRPLNKTLALMQLPYLGWLCFAAYLTATILVLN